MGTYLVSVKGGRGRYRGRSQVGRRRRRGYSNPGDVEAPCQLRPKQ